MICLVGVAHVVDLRERLVASLKEFHPAAIAIELDPERLASLMERAKGTDPAQGSKRGTPMLLRLWSNVQERLASELGELPGSEMLTAVEVARELNVPLFLIDDPLRQVAPRLMSGLTPKERVRLLISTVFALFVPAKIVKRELKSYEEGREEYLAVMRQEFPTVARVLLDERNVHMGERLAALGSRFERVAAVVGDAHVTGLEGILKPHTEVSVLHLLATVPRLPAPPAQEGNAA